MRVTGENLPRKRDMACLCPSGNESSGFIMSVTQQQYSQFKLYSTIAMTYSRKALMLRYLGILFSNSPNLCSSLDFNIDSKFFYYYMTSPICRTYPPGSYRPMPRVRCLWGAIFCNHNTRTGLPRFRIGRSQGLRRRQTKDNTQMTHLAPRLELKFLTRESKPDRRVGRQVTVN